MGLNTYPKRGEIYLVNLDPTVGAEINKTRPALIISNDINNQFSDTVTVIPITSYVEKVYPFEVLLPAVENGLSKNSKAKCNQIRKRPMSLAQSVRQRLLNLSRETKEPYNLILTRFALERLLYRISRSKWKTDFLLKGAMLFSTWQNAPHRPTKDLDLMKYGNVNINYLKELFQSLCLFIKVYE